MSENKRDWHMPFSAKRLLAGKIDNNAVTYLSSEVIDNPWLPNVLLQSCETRHLNKINSKDGFYMVFGAARHTVYLPGFKSGYAARKKAWVTLLNDQQVQKVTSIVELLEESQVGVDDPIEFEGDVFEVKCDQHPHYTKVIAIWVIRKSFKKPFKYDPKLLQSVKELTFVIWR